MPTETRGKSSSTTLICVVALLLLAVPVQSKAKQEADKILIVKSAHTMTLLSGGKMLKTYKVALGGVPVGPKRVEGDHKTPEGNYVIDAKNARSRFHLALHISYPSAADTETARKLGSRPGGAIMIHGLASSFAYLGPLHRQTDWTDGCIAVTNAEIEEIWRLVPVGTRVEIRP
ncbi:MAG TPA: L,D-transpeptidase family protein [Candidatus Angelobacter sp.]|jgi:murein L,D-transpeptidase YafK|nr:L,D-transpeptidase family protein [Candidatus Angelobacter sp.]